MGTIEKNKKLCLNCNYPIYKRRLGAIYCTVKCGYTYRNKQNAVLNKSQHERVRCIRHNDQILQKFMKQGENEVSYETLQYQKFYFEYYTKSILVNNKIEGAEFFRFKIQKMNNNTYEISII